MTNKKHYAAGVVAFVILGFFPIPLRDLKSYSAGQILYFRILFSLLAIAFVIALFKKKDLRIGWTHLNTLPRHDRRRVIWLTLAGGALLTINWLSFIHVVNSINVRTASFTYLICPVITAILGYVLINEKMTPLQWIAVTLCGISCIMMGISSRTELGYSVFTALTYALYLITQRKNQGFDRLVVLGIQVLISFVILTLFLNALVNEVPNAWPFYGNIVLIAVLFTVIPLFLNLFALNRINSATIGILMYLNPLINFTLAFVVFNESVSALQITGYSIIAVALLIFNLDNFRRISSI